MIGNELVNLNYEIDRLYSNSRGQSTQNRWRPRYCVTLVRPLNEMDFFLCLFNLLNSQTALRMKLQTSRTKNVFWYKIQMCLVRTPVGLPCSTAYGFHSLWSTVKTRKKANAPKRKRQRIENTQGRLREQKGVSRARLVQLVDTPAHPLTAALLLAYTQHGTALRIP